MLGARAIVQRRESVELGRVASARDASELCAPPRSRERSACARPGTLMVESTESDAPRRRAVRGSQRRSEAASR